MKVYVINFQEGIDGIFSTKEKALKVLLKESQRECGLVTQGEGLRLIDYGDVVHIEYFESEKEYKARAAKRKKRQECYGDITWRAEEIEMNKFQGDFNL